MHKKYDVIVLGGGPAGMACAVQSARFGASTLILDENEELGGQLVKQTHKFFGSRMHYAGYRGFEIAEIQRNKVIDSGIDVLTEAVVWHVAVNRVYVSLEGGSCTFAFRKLVVATGAKERPIYFPKWTLPGIIYAGALQTLVNIHRVSPGKSAVVVGSGNVGLIVAYQLVQAGIEVKAVIEKADKVGGYKVHANKLKALGVPILLSHDIISALGEYHCHGVQVSHANGRPKAIEAEIVCIATGMVSHNAILRAANINLFYHKAFDDFLPRFNNELVLLDNSDFLVAGDVAGVEEASVAIEAGRLAGLSSCKSLGLLVRSDDDLIAEVQGRLSELRYAGQ